jgi:hypothetical protein
MPALDRDDPTSECARKPGAVASRLLLHAFGRPRGLLGRLGGWVMARTNRDANRWVVDLLGIEAGMQVLEVGCGPGVYGTVGIRRPRRQLGAGPFPPSASLSSQS